MTRNYKVNDTYTVDTCLVYRREFSDVISFDSTYEKLYLDINNLLIVKKELFDKDNKLTYIEEIQ